MARPPLGPSRRLTSVSKAQRAYEAKKRQANRTRAVIGWIHPGDVAGAFMDSVCRTVLTEAGPNGLLSHGGGYISLRSGPRIAEARSQLVETFLTSELYRDAEWLFMVDSDMVFEPDALRRLLEVADPEERPIVGGLCFAGSSPEDCYPTLYRLVPHEEARWEIEKVTEWPEGELLKVGATGAAALLVHRGVLETMYRAFEFLPNGQRNNYPWFVEGHVDHAGRPLGEDIAFCIRAQGLGYPVHVHTGVEFGHRKYVVLDTKVWKGR